MAKKAVKTKETSRVKTVIGVLFAVGFFVFLLKPIEPTQTQTASVVVSEQINECGTCEETVKNLQAEIEELKSREPETKEIIKKVPVEKIVYKEVVKETACDPGIPNILSIEIKPGLNPTSILWKTDKPTRSKIFISGGDIADKKEYPSVFSLASEHRANIPGLQLRTSYFYEIVATTIERGKELGSATKQGNFYISPEVPEE